MAMPDEQPIPAEAITALQQGRKIEAIKLVRAAHGIGLKEAKHRVERHVAADPALQAALAAHTIRIGPGQVLRFMSLIALVVALLLWWKNG
jgi:hypothetical protein